MESTVLVRGKNSFYNGKNILDLMVFKYLYFGYCNCKSQVNPCSDCENTKTSEVI